MKHILIITLGLVSFLVSAQTPKERIKTLKTAYITKELNLTNEEAKEFWPIYEAYDQELEANRRKLGIMVLNESENIDQMNTEEAGQLITNYLKIEKSLYLAQENLIKSLDEIFTKPRIAKLLIAERSFNQRMLQRFRNRSGR